MCVLVLLRHPLSDWPVVVAANRDEFRARPAEGPQILEGCAVAGRDLEGGGTWLGINREAVVCAITNRRQPPRDPAHSRGHLVMEMLTRRQSTTDGVGGFNLLVANSSVAHVLEYDGASRTRQLGGDIHVVCSHRDTDDSESPETIAVRKLCRPCASIDGLRQHLRSIQASHDGEVCKHGGRYGTVSACFVAIHRAGLARSQFWCAQGQPCEATWRDCSDLLRSISAGTAR